MNDLEFVFDIEGDSLNPTKIHCMVVATPKGTYTITDYDEMRRCLMKAQTLVGHNIVRFDIPVLERILGIKIKARLIDTLALSWYLQPKRKLHGLASYGEDFGVPKPEVEDWTSQDISVYKHRCQEDVRINTHLWNAQYAKLKKIYETEVEINKFLEYIGFKMHCAMLQEKSGWKLDLEFTKEHLDKLEKIKDQKIDELAKIMPRIPVYVKKSPPKVMNKKDGTISSHGLKWQALLAERNLPLDTQEVEIIKEYEEPNPGSPHQIKNWLFSLGWVPTEFKHVKSKTTGEVRQVPQVNLPNNKGICPGIKRLYDKHPDLELIEGLGVLTHRISILNGFMATVNDKSYVKAQVQGLTNTLRFKHAMPCVNLPRAGRPYADGIRGSLICEDDEELVGADMSGLEDRLKQHYIYPLDPEYVETMNRDDFDPHLSLAVMAGMLEKDDAELYADYNIKSDDEKSEVSDNVKATVKRIKPVRDIAKNGNYACQYGAYPPRLVITCGITPDKAQELFDGYWKLNWSIKEVAKNQIVKTIDDEMWLWNPVSGFWYSLRKDNDRFSTLVQGTAAYVFDYWVSLVLKKRPQLTAQFHDEIVLCVKKGHKKEIENYLNDTIEATNESLKLNRRLDIGVQFGERYSDIH